MGTNIIKVQTYKTYNIDCRSSKIEISSDAWIEKSLDYVGFPKIFNYRPMPFSTDIDDMQFGLAQFHEHLKQSPVIIKGNIDTENRPFWNPCDYLGMALSIELKSYICIGIQHTLGINACGFNFSFFQGDNHENILSQENIINLKTIYRFIESIFTNYNPNNIETKITTFGLKSITKIPYRRHTIMNRDLNLFREHDEMILSASIFLEAILTLRSSKKSGQEKRVKTLE